MSETPNISLLLSHSGWIRTLARRLVSDPEVADDLVQDTWVQALESGPVQENSVRGWVAVVLRNNLSRRRMREAERTNREHDVSRSEETPSAHDIVERASLHKDVVEAVLDLDEPYRTTILMRFFEHQSYDSIAEVLGVTNSTVNSRVTRGLQQLRRRLDREYGGNRQAWLTALAPLAGTAQSIATSTSSLTKAGTLMNLAIGLGIAGAVAATASLTLMTPTEGPDATTIARTPSALASPVEGQSPTELLEPDGQQLDGRMSAPRPEERQPVEVPEAREQEERWQTDVSHTLYLAQDITNLSVSVASGNISLVEATDGIVSVRAKVSVNYEDTAAEDRTSVFEDHIEIKEGRSKLEIRDRHEGEDSTWELDLEVAIPRALDAAVALGAGDIRIAFCGDRVATAVGAGDVHLDLPRQHTSFTADVGAGKVVVDVLGLLDDSTISTGAGDARITVRGDASKSVTASCGAGSLHLFLPRGVYGAFELKTNAGAIEAAPEFGLVRDPKHGQTQRASGRIGTGGPTFKLQAGAGSLYLNWTDAANKGPI